MNDERESLKAHLDTARRILAVLEEQAAGYTKLTIPAYLQVELDEGMGAGGARAQLR